MNAINYISIFSILIPLTLSFFQWKTLRVPLSALRWLLVISLLADILGYLIGWLFRNSFPVGNIYSLVEFLFVAYIFSNFYKAKKTVKVVCIVYLIYFVVDVLFFESVFRMLTNASVLAMLLVIMLLLYYFFMQLIDSTVIRIEREPIFWIAFAFLLYYSGSLFVTVAFNTVIDLTEMKVITWNIWTIHNLCNISKNLLIAVALWLNYRTLRYST